MTTHDTHRPDTTSDPRDLSGLPGLAGPVARWMLWLTVASCAVGSIFALSLVMDDLSSHTDEFDGLGAMIGGVAVALLAVLGTPAALAAAWWRRRPRASRVAAVVAGALLVLVMVLIGSTTTAWALAPAAAGVWILVVAVVDLVQGRAPVRPRPVGHGG